MTASSSTSLPTGQKNYFLVRRLHSLLGLAPIGVYLCIHLFTNALILAPGGAGVEFQKAVDRIHSLGPFLLPVEILFIFLPLTLHALLGVKIWLSSSPNAMQYRYGSNIRYSLQRATGMIAFAFILYHLWQLHKFARPLGGGYFDEHQAAASTAAVFQTPGAWWVWWIYLVGVLSAVFHFANGVWTSLITWGITIRPQSQRVAGYVCTGLGVVLGLAGMGALRGFSTFDIGGAPSVSAESNHASTNSGH